jgi:hypothetical protein
MDNDTNGFFLAGDAVNTRHIVGVSR